ncbi:MAG: hypothetical protein J5J06_04035 [Phycisphaerae bacterium]|nr:hypothetical protein [Phycisphaerae bacterium]
MNDTATIIITSERSFVVQSSTEADREFNVFTCPVGSALMPQEMGDLVNLADQLAGFLRAEVPHVQNAILVVPSGWCFSQVLHRSDAQDSRAAIFEFESLVPAELEKLTCVAAAISDDEIAVSAVFTEPLREFLDRLETAFAQITSLVPEPLCLLQHLRGSDAANGVLVVDTIRNVTILPTPSAISSRLTEGTSDCSFADQDCLFLSEISHPFEIYPLGDNALPDVFGRLRPAPIGGAAVPNGDSYMRLLADAVHVHGHACDLRKGRLRSPARFAQAAKQAINTAWLVVVLLLLLSIRSGLTATRYRSATERNSIAQTQLLEEAFGATFRSPVPAMQIRSELNRLKALTDLRALPQAPLGNLALLGLFRDVADRIPEQAKIQIDEIAVERDRLQIMGQTTSHEDTGKLVASINESETIILEPPQSRLRNDGTVEFRLAGHRKE